MTKADRHANSRPTDERQTDERGSDKSPPDGCWLVRGGRVLASLEIPSTRRAKAIGLLGRDSFEGAILLQRARSVHTMGMRFDLDIALLDADNVVIKTLRLPRNRVSAPIVRARAVLEAEAGAFGLWDLKIGDELEIRS